LLKSMGGFEAIFFGRCAASIKKMNTVCY
jgi:hypothetical protein